ncbi:MAG TPA: hypothetical protein VFI95_17625, partial [Terriglobales bacterium]|nr:hypothetical protein [Terriglobales bacterium]
GMSGFMVSCEGSQFGADQRKRLIASGIPRVKFQQGDLSAEMIEDRRRHPNIVLCVIQKHGSPEILFLGQFNSQEEAEVAARQFISDYRVRHGNLDPPSA